MTVQSETQSTSNLPVITAEILKPEGVQLPPTHRCLNCAAQAWVEVEIPFTRTTRHLNTEVTKTTYEPGATLVVSETVIEGDKEVLLFCAHHYGASETVLVQTAVRIVDYRETLAQQEKGGARGGSV